ncbi:hypothetical protein BVRB_2g037120 [Beta vulgaris subsp. vulgaris]|nr:hypothetical protein BVRB_2g037120 [Beta vulgaris subsp. vulgaris]
MRWSKGMLAKKKSNRKNKLYGWNLEVGIDCHIANYNTYL